MGGSSAAQPTEVEYQVQAIQWTDAHWWEKNSKISSYRKGSRQTFRLCALGGANFPFIEGTDFHTIHMRWTHAGIGSKSGNQPTTQGTPPRTSGTPPRTSGTPPRNYFQFLNPGSHLLPNQKFPAYFDFFLSPYI